MGVRLLLVVVEDGMTKVTADNVYVRMPLATTPLDDAVEAFNDGIRQIYEELEGIDGGE